MGLPFVLTLTASPPPAPLESTFGDSSLRNVDLAYQTLEIQKEIRRTVGVRTKLTNVYEESARAISFRMLDFKTCSNTESKSNNLTSHHCIFEGIDVLQVTKAKIIHAIYSPLLCTVY